MSQLPIATMSSKGRIIIPEAIRLQMGLETGVQFAVTTDKDKNIVMKVIRSPRIPGFSGIVREIRKQVKIAGLTEHDLENAIRAERSKK